MKEKKYEFKKGDVITPHMDTGFSVVHLMAVPDLDYKLSWTQYVITILRPFKLTVKIDYK